MWDEVEGFGIGRKTPNKAFFLLYLIKRSLVHEEFRTWKNEKLYSGSFVLLMMLERTCSSCLLMVRRLEVGPGLEITQLLLLGKGDQEKYVDKNEWFRPGGATYLGQDQDSVGGGFYEKQSWSGEITQFNIWDFALEDYSIENAAECRSDILGNVMKWKLEHWITNDVKICFI